MRAAISARVSNDKQGRSASVPEQVSAGEADAASHGWDVMGKFCDSDISASRFALKDRPEWQRLQKAIESGSVDVVLLWSTSRGSRELEDWAGFLNRCRSRGVLVWVHTHGRIYDPRISRDWKTLAEDGVDNAAESDRKSEDVRRGLRGRLAAGKPAAAVPLGYRKVRDDAGRAVGLAIVPEKAAVARGLFQAVDAGEPVAAAARDAGLDRHTARYMLRNPAYAAQRLLADGSYVDCSWEPIITPALFWRVAERLDGHARAGRNPGAVRSLLGYLGTCGVCGDVVTTERARDSYRCRRGCVMYRPMDEADFRVELDLATLLEQPGIMEKFLPAAPEGEAAARQAEAAQLRAELDGWLHAGVTPRAYKIKEDELLPKIVAAEDLARKAAVPPALHPFMTMERAGEVWNILQKMTLHQVREVIRAVAHVEFSKGHEVEVMLR